MRFAICLLAILLIPLTVAAQCPGPNCPYCPGCYGGYCPQFAPGYGAYAPNPYWADYDRFRGRGGLLIVGGREGRDFGGLYRPRWNPDNYLGGGRGRGFAVGAGW
jgi:hypothetical protein